jgi:hypothetical protein
VVDAVTNTTTNNLRVRVRGLVATTSTGMLSDEGG